MNPGGSGPAPGRVPGGPAAAGHRARGAAGLSWPASPWAAPRYSRPAGTAGSPTRAGRATRCCAAPCSGPYLATAESVEGVVAQAGLDQRGDLNGVGFLLDQLD